MKKIFTFLTVLAAITLSAQTNLVPNHSFENWADGKPVDWYVPNSAIIAQSSEAQDGSSSTSITAPDSGNTQISPLNDIAVEQGVTYVFSGWYLDNAPDARFRYWAQFRNADGDTGPNPLQMEGYSEDSPEWVFFTAEGMPNAGADVIRAGLRTYHNDNVGGGVVLMDNIMVYDKSTMSVADLNNFADQVKMNTVVTNKLTLQLPQRATVNIYTMEGRLVSSNRVDNGGSVDTSAMTKGIYVVKVTNGYATTTQKIVKK
ncbi:T9SS type A sorting domain-containing protein [Moheibacter lacus]|uniref:T9SS type A sorting domain-containing protein n=1 Tax=Moheibacter lacus TaxID=2745851 RepID=A0A838ZRF5_9FLAO|nr:T9SS type A sorting domain-containing protein [Moheibacter lacus]MBA5628883.1 T9SS type A sorting domain-containing protein [Moheibacter lacus]